MLDNVCAELKVTVEMKARNAAEGRWKCCKTGLVRVDVKRSWTLTISIKTAVPSIGQAIKERPGVLLQGQYVGKVFNQSI